MSAAAGLSAARRRRAGGNTGSDTTPNQNTGSSSSPAKPSSQVNPMQILNNHEIRISQIMRKIDAMDKERNSLVDQINTFTEQSEQNLNTSEDVISELLQRTSLLEKNYESDNNKEDITFFKNKTKLLEEQLADVKRLLLKVQSFAMETNLSMMKVNKSVKSIAKDGGKDLNFPELKNEDLTK